MRHKTLKLGAILLIGIGLVKLQAQETILTTGGEASDNRGSVSYSIGQVTYQTHKSTSISVAEGVQQPYEISVLSAIKEAKGITISITIYPNPTIANLWLSINEFDHSNISYQLFDLNGMLLQNEKISRNLTNIAMDNFVPSTYFIRVIQNNNEIKIFKIIKSL